MRGSKAKSLRRATARFIERNQSRLPTGFIERTWDYIDGKGTVRLGPCPRKLYQVAKERYKKEAKYGRVR